jgi:hypothetical protein
MIEKGPHGLERGRPLQERAEQGQVEIGEQTAAVDLLASTLVKHMDGDAIVPPEPHFSHVQAPIDLRSV